MEAHFKDKYPYIEPTKTQSYGIEIDDKLLDCVLEAQRLFPKRLELVRRFQEIVQTNKVLEKLGYPTHEINEINSSKAYKLTTIGPPNSVGTTFVILPVSSEVSTPVTKSVYNVTTQQAYGQDLQLGVRVEIPLLATSQGEIQVIAGFLDLPSSQIRRSYFRKDASNTQAMDELKEVVELTLRIDPSMNP